jgi:hypothetical protein
MSEPHETKWSDGTVSPRCNPPRIGQGTVPVQPDWTCGTCGRVWRDMRSGPIQWWAEVRGPVQGLVGVDYAQSLRGMSGG